MGNFNIDFKNKLYSISVDDRTKLLDAIRHNFFVLVENGVKIIDYQTKYYDFFYDLFNYLKSNTNRMELQNLTLIAEGTYENNELIKENKENIGKKIKREIYPDWDSFCSFNKIDNRIDLHTIIRLLIAESLIFSISPSDN